jgi:hypothetical protein
MPSPSISTGRRTGFGLSSTIAGLGLGATGIGSNGIVERPNPNMERWGSAAVECQCESTRSPLFRTSNPDQRFVPFEICYEAASRYRASPYGYVMCYSADDPLTITLDPEGGYHQLDLDVSSDFGEYLDFANYLQQHPDAQLLFGYKVQFLDYTPVSAPEPSSLSLALLGVTATLLCRARKTRT